MKSRHHSHSQRQRIDNIDNTDIIDIIDYFPRRDATHLLNPIRLFRPLAARQGRLALPLIATGWGRADAPCGCASRSASRRRAGFTIIELLGVILVLATLFAMIMPAVKLSMRTAQKRQAGAEATALAQAVLRYRQTYGYWPGVESANISKDQAKESQIFLALADGKPPPWADPSFPAWFAGSVPFEHTEVIKALILRKDTPDNTANPRRIRFLDIPESRLDGDRFLDPWRTPYALVIYPSQDTMTNSPSIGGRPVGWSEVVAFSFGPPGSVLSDERTNRISRTAANLIFSAGVPR